MCLLMFLLMGSLISLGISVSPGKIELDFVPNGVYEGVAKWGPGARTNHLRISTGGDFEIIIDKDELICGVEPCETHYKIIMPESFDRPGIHGGYIKAAEVFDEPRPGFIKVTLEIKMPVRIFVPYPGKYLEFLSFKATNKEAGEEIPFEATLMSRGNETINSARGSIFVYDRYNKLVGSIKTNTVTDIKPGEKVYLYGAWDSGDYEKGRYHAQIIVNYDGLKTNKTTNFKLGGLDVELLNYTRKVVIGGIKPFHVLVESIWSEDIPNMRAEVSVLDNESEELTSFETLTKNLPAWGTTLLPGYLDTNPLNISDYKVSIILFFENLTKEYDGRISIIEEPSQEEGKGLGLLSRIFTIKNALIALIVLLIIVLGFLIYILIPKKEKYKKD